MPAALSGKITLSAIRQLAPGDEMRDSDVKGFGARRQAGVVAYFVHTRVQGRLRRITIGRHGSPWTPETARKEAARLLLDIRQGGNPATARVESRTATNTFDEVAEEFLAVHGRQLKPTTRETYRIIIRRQLLPAFAKKKMNDIRPVDVARAHASWSDTPRSANQAVAILSKLFAWAEQLGYREPADNPCRGINRYKETKRERYLTADELARLGQALAAAEEQGDNPWIIGLFRMLMLTGARLSEMTTLKWSHVETARGMIRLPDSKTGAKTIYLNQQAVAVLDGLPRIDGNPWVFPGHINGRHLVNVQKPWRVLRARAGLDDVRIHDLRHSFASIAIEVGGTLPMIGHLLGHSQAQTTARYAHVAPSPAQRIADAAGARIADAWQVADDERRYSPAKVPMTPKID